MHISFARLIIGFALLKNPKSKIAEQINIFEDMHWSWTFSIYIAFILIGWIHIELIFLRGVVHWLHTFYIIDTETLELQFSGAYNHFLLS